MTRALRRVRTDGYPMCAWEYEEDGKLLRASWDGRDDDNSLYVAADQWDAPAGLAVDAAARDRFFDALAAEMPCAYLVAGGLIVRWKRAPDSFLLTFHQSSVEYFELGRRAEVPTVRSGARLIVRAPAPRQWTQPHAPMSADEWRRVADRIRASTASDWYHSDTEMRSVQLPIVVDDAAESRILS